MLSALERGPRARQIPRPARSLRQEYEEFLFQRIEEYKNALSRAELLEIGDEAVRELDVAAADQYLLTEVLLLEHVDRIIARRLRLPSFQRWSRTHRALRAAQREPTHWEIEATSPLVPWARRLEPGDAAVVIGAFTIRLSGHYLPLGTIAFRQGLLMALSMGVAVFAGALVAIGSEERRTQSIASFASSARSAAGAGEENR